MLEFARSTNVDTGEPDPMIELWVDGKVRYAHLTGWFGPHGQRNRGEYDPVTNSRGSKRKTPKPPSQRGDAMPQEHLALGVPVGDPERRGKKPRQSAASERKARREPLPPPRADKPASVNTRPLIEHFEARFLEHAGVRYITTTPDAVQLASLARRLVVDVGSEEAMTADIVRCIDAAFQEAWFREHASLRTFCAQFNQYRAAANGRGPKPPSARSPVTAAPSPAAEFVE